MTYSTTAIILRRRDIGEWDRLYVAYTREHGKLTLLGKGTRRPKAKLASHLEPFAEVDLVIARGRTIDRVAFARTIHAHASALRTWEVVQTASLVVECVDQLTREGHRDVALFELLHTAFVVIANGAQSLAASGAWREAIPSRETADDFRHRITIPFTMRLLSILGYTPALDRCVECRAAVAPGSAIGFPDRGGIACLRCGTSAPTGIPLTAGDREFLAVASAQFSPSACTPAMSAFAEAHLAHHLVTPLRTLPSIPALTREPVRARIAES